MNGPQDSCRGCGSSRLRDHGSIPPASVFAGQPLAAPLDGGHLLECLACGLFQRSPIFEPTFYDALYAAAEAQEWATDAERVDHQLIAQALARHCPTGDVLDIGCGAGNLLASLAPGYSRFGIEIGEDAVVAAGARGIEIVGRSFFDLRTLPVRFDAVIACDVIEHHPDPQAFLDDALSILKPAGVFIMTSGNPDAMLWRFCGGRFWYSQFAEHVSFVTRRWIVRSAGPGAELAEFQRFRYGRMSNAQRLKLWGLWAWYMAAPDRYSKTIAKRRGWTGEVPYHAPPPGMGLTRDHLLAVVRRNGAAVDPDIEPGAAPSEEEPALREEQPGQRG